MNYDHWKLDNGRHEDDGTFSDVCHVIESDKSLAVACNTVEAMTGHSIEPDAYSVCLDNGTMHIGTNLGIRLWVDESDPQRDRDRQMVVALRELADQIEQRNLEHKPVADLDETVEPSRVDWLVVAAGALCCAVTWLAWSVW